LSFPHSSYLGRAPRGPTGELQHYSLHAFLQQRRVEVQQQANAQFRGPKVRKHLLTMELPQTRHGLHFNQYNPPDDKIDRLSRNFPVAISHENPLFAFERNVLRFELEAERAVIDDLLETGTESAVDSNGAANCCSD
jgi:hypothetical protein